MGIYKHLPAHGLCPSRLSYWGWGEGGNLLALSITGCLSKRNELLRDEANLLAFSNAESMSKQSELLGGEEGTNLLALTSAVSLTSSLSGSRLLRSHGPPH
jgi:hypothetical protein